MNQRAHQAEDGEADRNVDEEDPAPVVTVRDPAPERRTNRRGNDGGDAVDCRGHAPLLGGKAVGKDGLADRLQAAAEGTLGGAQEHQSTEARRQSTKEGCDCESGDGDQEEALAAEAGREPARDRHDRRVGDEVARQHPG